MAGELPAFAVAEPPERSPPERLVRDERLALALARVITSRSVNSGQPEWSNPIAFAAAVPPERRSPGSRLKVERHQWH
jgi:hypothetical protein